MDGRDETFVRAALTLDEFRRPADAAGGGRAVPCHIAATTSLRIEELQALRGGDMHLLAEAPHIHVPGFSSPLPSYAALAWPTSGALVGSAIRSASGPSIDAAQAIAYNGPKARLAILAFEDRTSSTGNQRAEFGRGLGDMLATALFLPNRFIVLERDAIDAELGSRRGTGSSTNTTCCRIAGSS